MLSALRGARHCSCWGRSLAAYYSNIGGTKGVALPQHQSSPEDPGPGSDIQGSSSPSTASISGPIYVACVLERLPVIPPAPPRWEAEFKAWEKEKDLERGYLQEYPDVDNILSPQEEGDAPKQAPSNQPLPFDPVPAVTKADVSGLMRTMRRKLDSRLYCLVRQKLEASTSEWQFPYAQHEGNEPIRETCERALVSTFGRKYPVYFIGNAPMAHLPLSRPGGGPAGAGCLFFMLAQAVDDPWDEQALVPESSAKDWVWVTRKELASKMITDDRMVHLACRMLS